MDKVWKHKHPEKVLTNCVNPKLGLHIFNCAFKTKQLQLSEIKE